MQNGTIRTVSLCSTRFSPFRIDFHLVIMTIIGKIASPVNTDGIGITHLFVQKKLIHSQLEECSFCWRAGSSIENIGKNGYLNALESYRALYIKLFMIPCTDTVLLNSRWVVWVSHSPSLKALADPIDPFEFALLMIAAAPSGKALVAWILPGDDWTVRGRSLSLVTGVSYTLIEYADTGPVITRAVIIATARMKYCIFNVFWEIIKK